MTENDALADIAQDIKQIAHVRYFKQTDLSLFDDVQDIKQIGSVEYFEQINDYDVIHFAVKLKPNKRSNIALEGYFIKALSRKYKVAPIVQTNNALV